MTRFGALRLPALALAAAAGCGDGSGPGSGPPVNCDEAEPTVLSPGQLTLTDASEAGCIRLADAGASGAEFLYVGYSADGEETREGTSAEYQLTGTAGAPPPTAVTRPAPGPAQLGTPAQRFHDRLRALGQELARNRTAPVAKDGADPAVKAVPPVVGEERTFSVLRSADVSGLDPDDYVQVVSTARYVGTTVAIFLDQAAPVGEGYTQADLDAIGALFDDHLHPIAVNAFGAETDVNGDGLVLVLLTDRVTRLIGCGAGSGQFVVGLFFAVDLIEGHVGSNDAEIFYGLTPDEECQVSREQAVSALPAVFVHEFQHMINFGQHAVQRDGEAENTWLDEGLSGFAEELGGRLVPNDRCFDNDCLTQFQAPNLVNAYNYLAQMDSAALIGPRQPPLPLTQYGATWLFVRWLVDHFAEDATLGTDLTRALVQTTRRGADNVVSATDTPFDQLLGEWQLANYLEDHPEFEDLTAGTRFGYPSWNLREIFASFSFASLYPLEPDVFDGDDYAHAGELGAGSGRHLLVDQPAGAPIDLRLTGPDGESALPSAVVPRTVLLRLR